MGQTSTTFVHPLKSVVIEDERRDPIGHLVTDPNTDREFRFCKFRGGQTGERGYPVFAWRLSGNTAENSFFNVTADAAASVGRERDFIGIFVGQSAIKSGQNGWVMTQGQLGKFGNSLYPDTVFAKTAKNATAGQHLRPKVLAGTSVYGLTDLEASDSYSGAVPKSTWTRVVGTAFSNDTGSNLTRGHIRSPILHGGPGYGPKTNL